MIQENEIICSVRVIRAMSMKINELLQLDDLAAEYSDLFEIDGINEWGVDITFHESSRYSNFSAFKKWILKLSEESRIPATHIVAETLVYVDEYPCDNVFFLSLDDESAYLWTLYVDQDDWVEGVAHISMVFSQSAIEHENQTWEEIACSMLDTLLVHDEKGKRRPQNLLKGFLFDGIAIYQDEWQEDMEGTIEGLHRKSWIQQLENPENLDKLLTIKQKFPLDMAEKASAIQTALKKNRESMFQNIDFDAYFWESLDEPYRKIHVVNGEEFIDGICYFLTLKLELEHHLSNGTPPFSRWKLASCQDFMGLKGGIDEVFAQMTVLEQILLQGQY